MKTVAHNKTRLVEYELVYSRPDRTLLAMADASRNGKNPLKNREQLEEIMGCYDRATFYRILRQLTDPGYLDSNIFGFDGKRKWFATPSGLRRTNEIEYAARQMELVRGEIDNIKDLLRTLDVVGESFDLKTRIYKSQIVYSRTDRLLLELAEIIRKDSNSVREFVCEQIMKLKEGGDRATTYRKLRVMCEAEILRHRYRGTYIVTDFGLDRVDKLKETESRMKLVNNKVESVAYLLRNLIEQELRSADLERKKLAAPKERIIEGMRMV